MKSLTVASLLLLGLGALGAPAEARRKQPRPVTVGKVTLKGELIFASHAHGGPPARVHVARIHVTNRSRRIARITFSKLWLETTYYRRKRTKRRRQIKVARFTVQRKGDQKPRPASRRLSIRPGDTLTWTLHFKKPLAIYTVYTGFELLSRLKIRRKKITVNHPIRAKRRFRLR